MRETIIVETSNLRVERRFWYFDYKVWRNGKLVSKGKLNGSHTRWPSTLRRILKRGGMTNDVLERSLF